MADGEVGVSGVLLLDPVVDELELVESVVELLDISDLSVVLGHVGQIVEAWHLC